ncbi:RICIN domain-containing protein [Clostridium felsineum]|uniref:RICIN domain-containing protein n=1 Tax=Clostridium felsineum TaxID=36839 RepID=UPI00214DCC65|nr:RICIN domain-containing protein [Clostridium felsineum]MCR3761162.1 RICIN domain-containing protein [Clostridium felsineum]
MRKKKILSSILVLSMVVTASSTFSLRNNVYKANSVYAATLNKVSNNDKRIRVDLAPFTSGRTDMFTKGWNNWVVNSGTSASQTYNSVTFKLSNGGNTGNGIQSGWCKGLIQSSLNSPTLTLDGVTSNATSGGVIKLEISGLPAGNHTLTTWHSFYDDVKGGSMSLYVDGKLKASGIKGPTRVTDDDAAGRAYVSFNAAAGKTVTVLIKPDNNGNYNNAVLNAFEIDGANPFQGISKPKPQDGDEHLQGNTLSWMAGQGAVSHDVYLGTDFNSVNNANTNSSLFKGNQKGTSYLASELSPMNTYYWRIDERDKNGTVTKGAVMSFRTAHLAFPSAEGYGRFARGGRGGRVIEVTNLNDSGSGSLRDAIENQKGPRTIIFRVGGVIALKSRLAVPADGGDVYVAGQTAPGDGITLTQYAFGLASADDVIIRDVRLRVGDVCGQAMDGMGMAGSNNSIIDHCSISWSIDEGTSSRGAHNISFQNNIIAEALNNSKHYNDSDPNHTGTQRHSFAGSISGNIGSFHHNLLTNCTGRNWSLAGGFEQDGKHYGGYLDITNNVVYNYKDRTTDGGARRVNFVGNYYKQGPVSNNMNFFSIDGDQLHTGDMQMAYLSGNKMVTIDGKTILNPNTDNWTKAGSAYSTVSQVRSNMPFFPSYVTTESADAAYETVLNNAGATKPKRDYLDTRYINEVKKGTYTYTGSVDHLKGIIDSQDDVGGYPKLKGGNAPVDSDHDGMSDEWEIKHGLNPNDPSDANKLNLSADGYTNLEMYLDELAGDNVKYKSTQTIDTSAISMGSYYKIKNVNSGKYLSVPNNTCGSKIVQTGNVDSSNSIWQVIQADNGCVKLISQAGIDGKVIDVPGASNDNGVQLQIWNSASSFVPYEEFQLKDNKDGTFGILTKSSGGTKGFDVNGHSTAEGASIIQYNYNGAANQKWIFQKIN